MLQKRPSFDVKCWETIFLKLESNMVLLSRDHSNHPQGPGTPATTGAKMLTLSGKHTSFHVHIPKLHRQEPHFFEMWGRELSAFFCKPSSRNMLRAMLRAPRHQVANQRRADDMSEMLECSFHGDTALPTAMIMPALTEPPSTMAKWRRAISQLNIKE